MSYGHSSTGRATVSKTVAEGSSPSARANCSEQIMEKLKLYLKESYHELVDKVTWPTWQKSI